MKKKLDKQFATPAIALELKALGFNEECLAYYRKNTDDHFQKIDGEYSLIAQDFHGGYYDSMCVKNNESPISLPDTYCAAPLWQQVVDWFDEEKGFAIMHYYNTNCNEWQFIIVDKRNDGMSDNYYSNEQAILKAIEILKSRLPE